MATTGAYAIEAAMTGWDVLRNGERVANESTRDRARACAERMEQAERAYLAGETLDADLRCYLPEPLKARALRDAGGMSR